MASRKKKERVPCVIDSAEDKKWRDIYAPYAAELGYAIIAWNRLHENLGLLWWQLLRNKDGLIAMQAWHASDNDRILRDMSIAAAEVSMKRRPKILDDVKWLMKKVQELSADRNTAAHGLFMIEESPDGNFKVIPDYGTGHAKSKKLKDADLIKEFASYADCATLLSRFAYMLGNHLFSSKHWPWPQRPVLPPKWQSVTQAEQRQKKADKLRRHRLQSVRVKDGEKRALKKIGVR